MSSLPSILTLILFSFISINHALQVTPNSPCASFCVDSNDLDYSDPNSSNTLNKDVNCHDRDYASTASGQKFRRCLSCLQDSTFSQGSETDQGWFLYNLRYTFDHCIFGFPNATDIESTPCSTSTACGGLENALTGDKLNVKGGLDPYGFCGADGEAMVNTQIEKCISCVSASQDQKYLANFMVALEAGCTQKPAAGTAVGLNDTVFSPTLIGMVDPISSSAAESAEAPALGIPALVGIAIGGVVLLLAIAGLIFVRRRTRRNRRQRLAASLDGNAPNRRKGHRPASSLSFRCQTHLSPRSPGFSSNVADPNTLQEEKMTPYMSPTAALGSNPVSASPYWSPSIAPSSGFRSGERSYRGSPNLRNIATSAPTVPDHVHYSTSPKAKGFSPVDTATPASAVSTKSTAQLLPLRSYNPADYTSVTQPPMSAAGVMDHQHHKSPYSGYHAANNNHSNPYASPTSASTASPLLSRAWEQQPLQRTAWDPLPTLPQRSGPNHRLPAVKVLVGSGEKAVANKGKRGSNTGSPVESEEIKVSFAGPPPYRRQ
ncbi:LPXTG-domain-containing protein [Apiospora marii]|uniref:LPXTG-domain-containing protein n=1 Tax=Apiospora marii TaxID=335849 RepID=A0ABR1R4T0_9PEZI